MINFDSTGMSEEFAKTAPMECALYLFSCLPKEKQASLKKEWDAMGGVDAMYWYQFILNNVSVMTDKDLVKETGNRFNIPEKIVIDLDKDTLVKLGMAFPDSIVNESGYFVANNSMNWFDLKNCHSEEDVAWNIIANITRGAFKSSPYFNERDNENYHLDTLQCINRYFGTSFKTEDIKQIYTHFGNGINMDRARAFIRGGCDLDTLKLSNDQCNYRGIENGTIFILTLNQSEKFINKLLASFPGSSINSAGEFIANREKDWFSLKKSESELDVKCKILEYFSRSAFKSSPHVSPKSNDDYHARTLLGINILLGTAFTIEDMETIYTYLGTGVNHQLTINFINSGYDLSLLIKGNDKEPVSDIELD